MEPTATTVILGPPGPSRTLPRSWPAPQMGGAGGPYAERLERGAVPNCGSEGEVTPSISGSISRLIRAVQARPANTVMTPNTTHTSINNFSQCMNPPGSMEQPSGADYRANPQSWER